MCDEKKKNHHAKSCISYKTLKPHFSFRKSIIPFVSYLGNNATAWAHVIVKMYLCAPLAQPVSGANCLCFPYKLELTCAILRLLTSVISIAKQEAKSL